jgi:hypothetical protein
MTGIEPVTSPLPREWALFQGLRDAPLLRPRVLLAHSGARSTLTRNLQTLELMTGIEPVTSPLPRECSTN